MLAEQAAGAKAAAPGPQGTRTASPALLGVPFAWQAAAAVGLTFLFVLWVRGSWGGDWATTVFVDVASTLVPIGAAWACWMRARRTATLRPAWLLLSAACFSWALGQAAWTGIELATGEPPETPSLADLGYLGFAPLAAWGVVRFTRSQTTDYFRAGLDGVIAGGCLVYIAFVFGLEDTLLASAQTDAAQIVNLLYPFGDALVLGVAFQRLSRAPADGRPALALVVAGLVALAVADLWFLVVDAQGQYDTGGVLDAFWIAGFQLIGLAAMRPTTLQAPLDGDRQTPTLALVPLLPFLPAFVAAMYAHVRDGGLSDTLFWTSAVIIMAVVSRLTLMLLENVDLTMQASKAAEELRLEKSKRTRMMNAITHDMLNAMSPIRLQVHMLQRGMHGELAEPQRGAIAMVTRNAEQIARLATDMKEGANVEEGRLRIRPGTADLAATLREAVEARRGEAVQRGLSLSLEAPESVPWTADAGRITQVVDNLLSNALKFTPRGGSIRVQLSTNGRLATVRIEDSGRGLSMAEQAKLFQAYSQVHDLNEIKEHGTGLGLYISKGIVEQHGGRIGVESAGHGQGSTFWFSLPDPSSGRDPT